MVTLWVAVSPAGVALRLGLQQTVHTLPPPAAWPAVGAAAAAASSPLTVMQRRLRRLIEQSFAQQALVARELPRDVREMLQLEGDSATATRAPSMAMLAASGRPAAAAAGAGPA
jgi:hypothetical protein